MGLFLFVVSFIFSICFFFYFVFFFFFFVFFVFFFFFFLFFFYIFFSFLFSFFFHLIIIQNRTFGNFEIYDVDPQQKIVVFYSKREKSEAKHEVLFEKLKPALPALILKKK